MESIRKFSEKVQPEPKMFFLIIIYMACSAASSSIDNDMMALLALRDGFIHGGSPLDDSYLNSWNSSRHVCDWDGIVCGRRHKRVTKINLVKQNLKGVISPSIGNLSFLRVLNLSINSLHGEIPPQIGYLHRLEYLYLPQNSFQGHIPKELSNCSNLIHIYFPRNELTGRLPFQLGSLSKITEFTVQQNYLDGEMPTFFRNYSSLSGLDIGDNNMHGEIRDSLQGLSKLKFLSLNNNSFSGMISPVYNLSSLNTLSLGNNYFKGTLAQNIDLMLPKLMWLSLTSNELSGIIPSSMFNISGLIVIQLDLNKFRGRVPNNLGHLKRLSILELLGNNFGGSDNDLEFIDSLTNCTELNALVLERNLFVGPIPNSIGNLSSNLWLIGMGNNSIKGAIPDGIGQLSGLTVVDVGDNMLTGTIPNSIGNIPNLYKLFLSNNVLHGAIPSSLGNLTDLYILLLGRNLLEGIVPTSLRNCMSMQGFDVSNNHLHGYLPDDTFNQWPKLTHCNLSHNYFHGSFPSVYVNVETFNVLDASYNNFTGQIPAQLSDSLVFLSFAGNSFQGSIPTSLGSLKGLSWLDLSSNNLSGQVPKELVSLVLVQYLNLSFNQLEGMVPIFKYATGVSVIGNNKLCGGNPELGLLPCPLETKRKHISQKVIIVATISIVSFLSLLLFLFLCFFRRRKQGKENINGLDEKYRRITYAQLFKATKGFDESNLIGSGSFGDVFIGNLDEESVVAVKALKLSKCGARKSFIAECKVLRSIRHRNLLGIVTSCSSIDHKGNDFMALVFNFMSGGNLDSWLHISQDQEARTPLTLAKRLQIALDVACALNYLHNCCEPPIVHCDLKPSNILLDDDMVAHVGDFGLAKLLKGDMENISEGESLSTAIRGTVGYVAPEHGMGAAILPLGDIYSYGILLLELITRKKPTNEMFTNEMNLRSYVQRALPYHIEDVVDECLVNELHEAAATQTNPELFKLQYHTSLVSFVEVGISCSAESPKDRMEIPSAIKCLMYIKEKGGIIC